MRLKLIASVPLLVLVACGTPSKTRVGAAPEAPLQAALLPPTHGLGFWVNQSAYVAVFDITPGSGIGLLYPNFGRDLERPVSAGPRWAAVSPAYRANQAFFERPGAGSGMRYLFLIASRAPLNIDNTVGYADYLRTKMGPVAFTGGAFASMKTLISEVVPEQPEGDWTTAMYIVPGTGGGRRGGVIYQLVRCQDGRVYAISIDYPSVFFCPLSQDSVSRRHPVDTLKVDSASSGRRKNVLLVDPKRAVAAAELLRRPVSKVQRPPMPPELRFNERRFRDGRRSDPGSSPVGNGGTTATPQPQPTVTTEAQSPSNGSGRRAVGGDPPARPVSKPTGEGRTPN